MGCTESSRNDSDGHINRVKSLIRLLERHRYLFLLLAYVCRVKPGTESGTEIGPKPHIDIEIGIIPAWDELCDENAPEVEDDLDKVFRVTEALDKWYVKVLEQFGRPDEGPYADAVPWRFWWQLADSGSCTVMQVSSEDITRWCHLLSVAEGMIDFGTDFEKAAATAFDSDELIWEPDVRINWNYPQRIHAVIKSLMRLRDRLAGRPDCWHSEGFSNVTWHGTSYAFNKMQARVVAVLWKDFETGGDGLSSAKISDEVTGEDSSIRMEHVFRKPSKKRGEFIMHPAWGTMIKRIARAKYKLVPPEHPLPEPESQKNHSGRASGKKKSQKNHVRRHT